MKLIFKLIWIGLLIEIIILAIIRPYIEDFGLVSIIAVSVHVLYTMSILIAYRNKYNTILLGAFLFRVAFMVWDVYASHIYSLPNSGYDSGMFYRNAIAVSQNMLLLSEPIRGGYYSKATGILFYWIGPQQLLGHYLNVLLGLTVVFIIYKILIILELKPRVVNIILLIAAFFPNSLVMSAIFLREIVVTFFVVCSLYFFIKWFKTGLNIDMLLTLAMLGLASIFHSGVIGIFFGYAFMFMFYKQGDRGFRINSKTVYIFLFLTLIVFLVITQFNDLFLAHFISSEDEFRDFYVVADAREGGSVYLTNITIDNPFQFIIYGPIKAFYFLTSPLPTDWRGLMDIFTFFSDSVLYLGTIIYFVKNSNNFRDKKVLIIGLVLALVCVSLIFGIGVYNAGTAVRHRHKIIPIILILLAVMMDMKNTKANTINLRNKLAS